jgi:Transposase zinc-binding domain
MRGHLTHAQLKVMSAIEACRTADLGGHVARCEQCHHTAIAYNSCRNRHCPKCQGSQAREWLEARKAELLEVPYFHVVFPLPPRIAAIALQNKAVIYDLLFKASAETLLTIAADPKRLGVRIGFTSVLHTRAFRRSGRRFAARKARQPKRGSAPRRAGGARR